MDGSPAGLASFSSVFLFFSSPCRYSNRPRWKNMSPRNISVPSAWTSLIDLTGHASTNLRGFSSPLATSSVRSLRSLSCVLFCAITHLSACSRRYGYGGPCLHLARVVLHQRSKHSGHTCKYWTMRQSFMYSIIFGLSESRREVIMMFSRGLGSRTNGSPVWELTSNGWNGFAIFFGCEF